MIQELSVAITALKAVTGLAKDLSSLNTELEIREKTSQMLGVIIDLQGAILDLQGRFADLQSENLELRRTLEQAKANAGDAKKPRFDGIVFWNDGDNRPLCPKCLEGNHNEVHLVGPEELRGDNRHGYYCRVCDEEIPL